MFNGVLILSEDFALEAEEHRKWFNTDEVRLTVLMCAPQLKAHQFMIKYEKSTLLKNRLQVLKHEKYATLKNREHVQVLRNATRSNYN